MFSYLLQTRGSAESHRGTHAQSAASFSKGAIHFILPTSNVGGIGFPLTSSCYFSKFYSKLTDRFEMTFLLSLRRAFLLVGFFFKYMGVLPKCICAVCA